MYVAIRQKMKNGTIITIRGNICVQQQAIVIANMLISKTKKVKIASNDGVIFFSCLFFFIEN